MTGMRCFALSWSAAPEWRSDSMRSDAMVPASVHLSTRACTAVLIVRRRATAPLIRCFCSQNEQCSTWSNGPLLH
nr:MAG TPA: hypothetical protein [Caudoviricetes sp.]